MNDNLSEVDAVIALAHDLNLPLKVRRAKPYGRALSGSNIITKPSDAYFSAILKLNAARCSIEDIMNLSYAAKDQLILSENDCGAGTRIIFVNEDLSVSPCVFLGDAFISGKWSNGMLAKIWKTSPQFIALRMKRENSECMSCTRRRICHSECVAMRLHVGDSLDAQDPGCLESMLSPKVPREGDINV
jgi:radical SAM protein with 4Fe4S-binding SPASM domain